jgi:hypothetical protein
MHFLENNYILLVMNSGAMHLAHPSQNELLCANLFQTLVNQYMSVNDQGDRILCLSEFGMAQTLDVEFTGDAS